MKIFIQLRSIVLLVILNVFSHGYADEHDNVSNNEEKKLERVKEVESGSEPQNEPIEAFIPTETISEDLSVPFPVDI